MDRSAGTPDVMDGTACSQVLTLRVIGLECVVEPDFTVRATLFVRIQTTYFVETATRV